MNVRIRNKTLNDIFSLIDVGNATECWQWTGGTTVDGYGRTRYRGKKHGTHRLVYECVYGLLDDDTDISLSRANHIHHLCNNPICNNPHHLEEVTPQQHASLREAKTHCPHGHRLIGHNAKRTSKGSIACRICHAVSDQKRKAANPLLFRQKKATNQRRYRHRRKWL